MQLLNDPSKLSLFKELMDKAVEKSSLNIHFSEFRKVELDKLALEITDSSYSGAKISGSTLRDYRQMYLENHDYPLKVSWGKLLLLCEFADLDVDEFLTKKTDLSKYNLVLLIIAERYAGDNLLRKGEISEIIVDRYKEFGELHGLEGCYILYDAELESPSTLKEARKQAESHEAHMVVWGRYISNDLKINCLLVNGNEVNYTPEFSFQPLERPSDIYEGKILQNPDFLLLYSYAIRTYEIEGSEKSIYYLEQCLKINGGDPDILFRLGVLNHELQKFSKAKKYYDLTVQNSLIDDSVHIKGLLNLIALLRADGEYQKAIETLEAIPDKIEFKNKLMSLKFQLYLLNDQPELAEPLLKLIMGAEASMNPNALNADLEVENKGQYYAIVDDRGKVALRNESDIVVESTILYNEDMIYVNDGHVEKVIINLATKELYKLPIHKTKSKVRDSILLLSSFNLERNSLFNQYSQMNRWIILEEVEIPILPYESESDDVFVLKYKCDNETYQIILPADEGAMLLKRETLELHFSGKEWNDIKIVVNNPYREEELVQYNEIMGFVFMSSAYLRDVIRRYQSLSMGNNEDYLKRSAELIYQCYGIIPERYFVEG